MVSFPAQSRAPGDGTHLMQRGLIVLLVFVFAGLLFFRAGSIMWRYEDIVRAGHDQAGKFAHVLAEHLQQSFATVDATFAHLVAYSAQIGGPTAQTEEWPKVLGAALSGLKAVDRISVLDRDGTIRHSTWSGIVGERREDHPVFRLLSQTRDIGVVANGLYRNPDTERVTLPIARALTSQTYEFDGIVVALFDPQLLAGFYREIDFGRRSVISIVTEDGEVIFQQGQTDRLTALAGRVRELSTEINDPGEALVRHFREPIAEDGGSYFTVTQRLSNFPLWIAVSLPETEILSSWRHELHLSIIVLGTVALLFLIGGSILSRELRARSAADAALRQNEARFHEIMYRAPILVTVKDRQGRVKFINKAMEELFGIPWKDAIGKRLKEFESVRSGPAELISSLDREVAETGTAIQRELTYPTKQGTRTAMFVKFPLLDELGGIDSIASFSVDLTDQRRATTWFSTIMDHAPALIALRDIDGRFVFVNRALAEASGMQVSDFLGRRLHDVFPPEYAALQEEIDREVIEARAPVQREFVAPYAKGTRTLLFVKFPIFDGKGNIESIGSIATDISDQKQAERQLAQAQRMEAVGQLTGGIAHDFNNLLTVIIGNAEILAEELEDNERLEPLSRLTLEAAERSAALTQRLLAFGRRQVLEPRPTDVAKLVEEMEPLCRQAAGARIPIEIRAADPGLWPAMVDAGQLETAIINLVVNARDAMPGGGRIVVDIENGVLDESYVELNPDAKRGDYVMIAVSDTGSGMPPDVVARVFEPFFTTKEAGKGTGLGLPTIYGFVKQSGGHIKIYSEVGHGTVVRLYFPRANAPSIVPDLAGDADSVLPGGKEYILLVEDDRIVRDHTEGQLVSLGYRVTTAASPEEAIRLARLTGRPDLLITDVVMGGSMNGRQLAERLRAHWPDVRVLCVSGYTDGVLPELIDGLADGMHFLAKPYRRRDLAYKVREALDVRALAEAVAN